MNITTTLTDEESLKNKTQLDLTLQWVEDNYQWADGVCIPRCVLFQHYQDFCRKNFLISVGPATFGKIIRQKFPKLTTRRLGTRGQSRYHYYGIGVKESSVYYKQVYSGKGLSRFSRAKVKTELTGKKYNLASKNGTLLPEFPDVCDLGTNPVDQDTVRTFLVMYHTHCQRILDTVVSANFVEVKQYLLHFWQRLPHHILDVTRSEDVADIIAVCDLILYKVMNDVLVPSTVQDLPESLCLEMRSFLEMLTDWLNEALVASPHAVKVRKIEVANWFVTSVRRQLTFIYLAQTARSILGNTDLVHQMICDLSIIDLPDIFTQLGVVEKSSQSRCNFNNLRLYFEMFIHLLEKQTPLEDLMEWMDEIIENCAFSTNSGTICKLYSEDLTSHFLLRWSYLACLIVRELTLRSSASFGSLHLLRVMFDEYLFLVLETHNIRRKEESLKNSILKFLRPGSKFEFSCYNGMTGFHIPSHFTCTEPLKMFTECSGNILDLGQTEEVGSHQSYDVLLPDMDNAVKL